MSDEDLLDMQTCLGVSSSQQAAKNDAFLMIRKDGKVRFDYCGMLYEGQMQDKRYYGKIREPFPYRERISTPVFSH